MDCIIFGSCLIKKIGAIFVHFSTLRSVIFHIFIYVLEENSASVFLFKNLGNLKTNTTKILVLVLQNLTLLDSSFLGCFIREIATIYTIPWFSNCDISKSSTWWPILLFIIWFILSLPTQKCKFCNNDMDFGFVVSFLNTWILKNACPPCKCLQFFFTKCKRA